MILLNIKETVCSDCAARVVSEERRNKHCNGQWNERREFSCGKTLVYSPNFQSLTAHTACSEKPEEKEKLKARQKARRLLEQHLERYIKKLDVDEDYRVFLNKQMPVPRYMP